MKINLILGLSLLYCIVKLKNHNKVFGSTSKITNDHLKLCPLSKKYNPLDNDILNVLNETQKNIFSKYPTNFLLDSTISHNADGEVLIDLSRV